MEEHLHVKIVKSETGRTCCGSAAYRAGARIIGANGAVHDFTRKKGIITTGIMLPNGAPAEYADRQTLWQAADRAERRKDAQRYRDVNIAIPNEISYPRAESIIRRFLEPYVADGMIADYAIHDPPGPPPNLHVHIMLTMRDVSPSGFGKKRTDWNRRELVLGMRSRWAHLCNVELNRIGSPDWVEHESYAERGMPKLASRHIGPERKATDENTGIISTNKAMRYNHSKKKVVWVPKELWKELQSRLDVLDSPYHRLTRAEEQTICEEHRQGYFALAVPVKDLEATREQEIIERARERQRVIRDRQRAVWMIRDAEQKLIDDLRRDTGHQTGETQAEWDYYHSAQEEASAAWKRAKSVFCADRDAAIDEAIAASDKANAAYKRAKQITGENNRVVNAERIIRNYRNYALGVARDVYAPAEELQAAQEAYRDCIKLLSEKNNSKNRSHLKRKLEAMQRDTEAAQNKRRRQRRLKSLLPRRSLDDQIQKAHSQAQAKQNQTEKERSLR